MRITVLELPATWACPHQALDEVDARLAAGPSDLVLLPEASLQGYISPDGDCDLEPFAEPIDGPIARRCAAIARARATHLCAPLVLSEGAAIYNAMACFDPRGDVAFVYRKRHPWFPETWATPGREPLPTLAIGGRTFTIAVCYDVHFLVEDASDVLAAADVLLFPSAWVEEPDQRVTHLQQLARRFALHVANANWAPGVVHVPGQGGSCFVDPQGRVLARAARGGRLDLELP